MSDAIRLLVADDEDLIRRRICLMLGDRFVIREAATTASARELFRSECFDAVLLDIMFPDGNGIDLCREIKGTRPHVTVVISSSLESVDAWNRSFQAGADDYLEKRELLALDPKKIVLTITSLVERNRLRQQAEETSKRQAELLSVLSHDVRAPFQALLGTIELLRREEIPPKAHAKVDTLHQCVKDQLAFINSLLELLRLGSGMAEFRRSRIDLNLPVNQCLQTLAILASKKEITLHRDLERDLPGIEADMGRISQLTGNLVNNAIKFTPRGGAITVRTTRYSLKGVRGVELAVEDSGVGITHEEKEKLFQHFRKGRDRGTEGETGTGLGLAICKEIVQLHGGSLELEPAHPNGTIARAWFPEEQLRCSTGPGGGVQSNAGSMNHQDAKSARKPVSRNARAH
ncbi:MAG: ATP-binding protein [Thermodesulfobacteriota bacterium]